MRSYFVGWNPDSSLETEYVPGGSSGTSKCPALFETLDRDMPVAVLTAVIVTPGSKPPASSVTLPEMEPVLLCANAENGTMAMSRAIANRKRICFTWLIEPPCMRVDWNGI